MVDYAKVYLNEWRAMIDNEISNTLRSQNYVLRWERPQQGWLKLNVDATIDEENGRMGFGWVLRDEEGVFKAAVSKVWRGAFLSREAEAVAIRETLSWIKAKKL